MEVGVQGCVILVQLIPQAPRAQEDAFMARQQLQAGGAQHFRLGQACQSKACTAACLTICTDFSVQASREPGLPGALRKSAQVYCAARPCCR